jgi:hypothetical protein
MADSNQQKIVFGQEPCPGETVAIGGQAYVFAPLSLGAVKRFRAAIRKIQDGGATPDESLDTATAVIYASLARNYPTMTLEYMEENIVNIKNWSALFNVALGVSGYAKQADSGNVDAGSPPI